VPDDVEATVRQQLPRAPPAPGADLLSVLSCLTIRLVVLLVGAAVARLPAPRPSSLPSARSALALASSAADSRAMSSSAVKSVSRLGFPYETQDPFLFCTAVHVCVCWRCIHCVCVCARARSRACVAWH